jgi:hypothetical protein
MKMANLLLELPARRSDKMRAGRGLARRRSRGVLRVENRLIFLFQPSAAHPDVPFDLDTFRYELITDTGQIVEKLQPHLNAILSAAAVGP